MGDAENTRIESAEATEEWFLTQLERDPLPTGELLDFFRRMAQEGEEGGEAYDQWADLLQDALAEREDAESALQLLDIRQTWAPDEKAFGETARSACDAARRDRMWKVMVAECGFDAGLPATECLRRLDLLCALQPGALCHDKTWGFGIVKDVDDFYKKITIDFTSKAGHQMSLAYAAESLERIGDEHLYARQHRDPEGMQRLVSESPAEVVRIALRSYGARTAAELQELLCAGVVKPGDWKRFWDAARKELKGDPLVDVPARRSDPVQLLQREKAYDAEWFSGLATERAPEAVLEAVLELERAGVKDVGEESLAILEARVLYGIDASMRRRPDMVARYILAVRRMGLAGHFGGGLDAAMSSLVETVGFASAASGVPAREVEQLIDCLGEHAADALSGLLVEGFLEFPMHVTDAAAAFLEASGRGESLAARLRVVMSERTASPQALCWLCRHRDKLGAWDVVALPELLYQAVESFDRSFSADRLRAHKQLKGLFEDVEWLKDAMAALEPHERAMLFGKVANGQGGEAAWRRSLMARMIKLHPELEQVAEEGDTEPAGESGKVRLTTWRSHRERHRQLQRLVDVDIPANSREIGVARSYGDLRENFEYQAARDQQVLLMRRKTELELDLEAVKGSDFASSPTDSVGMGTCVTLRFADGKEKRYCILGEWDSDEALGIVPSQSRLAVALAGRKAGDDVEVPTEDGNAAARIVDIAPLPDEVRRWIDGEPQAAAASGDEG